MSWEPKNEGTKRNPLYRGPVRHRGLQRWVTGGPFTSLDAWRAAAAEVRLRIDKELDADPNAPVYTIREYVDELWLKLHVRPSERTNEKLRGDIKAFVAQYGDRTFEWFGVLRNRMAVREWAVEQSPNAWRAARAMWNNAATDGVPGGVANPFEKLGIPESRGRANITVLSEEDVELLCQCAHHLYPGIYGNLLEGKLKYLAYTGCRPGEGDALSEFEIDLESEEAVISWGGVRMTRGRLTRTPTKTETGERTVVVPPPAIAAVQKAPRLHDLLLFVTTRGHPFLKNSWTYYWHPIRSLFCAQLSDEHHLNRRLAWCADQGVDPNLVGEGRGAFHTYELRHFGLTRMLELGNWANYADVAYQAGHKDPELLYKTYGHPDRRRTLERLKLLNRATLTNADLGRLAETE